ncbi:MAG: hypothetical protein LBU57_05485, partial [Dysgonamonadaceae bacterium]|nr:hypothetical protein [Dysgonamonadaceae bacterium]
ENGSDNASKGAPNLKGYKPGDLSPTGALAFPELNNLSEYEMLGFTLYYLDLHNAYFYDVTSTKVAAMLKKKDNGKIYLLTFACEGNYNKKSMSASLLDFVELAQANDSASTWGHNMLLIGWCDPMFGSYPYIFFTDTGRNRVYRYDCDRHRLQPVYTSDSPVTALYLPEPGATTKTVNPTAHPYFNKLLIGTQNGDIICMDMPVVTTEDFTQLHTYHTGKEIVDFAFVPNESSVSSNLAK